MLRDCRQYNSCPLRRSKGYCLYNCNHYIPEYSKLKEPKTLTEKDTMPQLLSHEALNWLNSINYASKTHEERMKLIEAAKIAYPNKEDDESEEMRFIRIMGLA